jgi:hypothetical protein
VIPHVTELTDVLECVVPGRLGVYASAPITSGRHSFDLRKKNARPTREDVQRRVLEPNLREARKFALDLRTRFGYRVIDPSRLPFLSGWEQSDYYHLWSEVVRHRTEVAVFLDGWEFSRGCRNEFQVAIESGVPVCDSQFVPIDRARGSELMRNALRELNCEGQDVTSLASFVTPTNSAPSHGKISKSHLCSLMIGCVVDPQQAVVCYSLPLEPSSTHSSTALQEAGCHEADSQSCAAEQRRLITMMRTSTGQPVIDTGAFAPPSWSRRDLNELWVQVILTYGEKLILPKHWRAVDKYLQVLQTVARHGIRVTDERGHAVEPIFATT